MTHNYRYLIGDVHSRADLLRPLLGEIDPLLTLQLGDLCDAKGENKGSFLDVVNLIRQHEITSLIGNHDANLINHMSGQKMARCLKHTMSEVNKLTDEERASLLLWMQSRPLTREWTLNNKTYCAAHAYWQPGAQLKLNETISGKTIEGVRVKWWLKDDPEQTFCRISGHYHQLFFGVKSIVLDPFGADTSGIAAIDLLTSTLITSTPEGISRAQL